MDARPCGNENVVMFRHRIPTSLHVKERIDQHSWSLWKSDPCWDPPFCCVAVVKEVYRLQTRYMHLLHSSEPCAQEERGFRARLGNYKSWTCRPHEPLKNPLGFFKDHDLIHRLYWVYIWMSMSEWGTLEDAAKRGSAVARLAATGSDWSAMIEISITASRKESCCQGSSFWWDGTAAAVVWFKKNWSYWLANYLNNIQ